MTKPVVVFSTTDPLEPKMIVEMLNNNGIDAAFKGTRAEMVGAGRSLFKQQVLVPEEDADKARELIESLHGDYDPPADGTEEEA